MWTGKWSYVKNIAGSCLELIFCGLRVLSAFLVETKPIHFGWQEKLQLCPLQNLQKDVSVLISLTKIETRKKEETKVSGIYVVPDIYSGFKFDDSEHSTIFKTPIICWLKTLEKGYLWKITTVFSRSLQNAEIFLKSKIILLFHRKGWELPQNNVWISSRPSFYLICSKCNSMQPQQAPSLKESLEEKIY